MSTWEEFKERLMNETWNERLWHKFKRATNFKAHCFRSRHVLLNKWERMQKGYGHMDLWSFDSYLSRVIAEGCRELADVTHSYPQGDDCPTFEDWQHILNKIADGFDIGYMHWDLPDDTWPNGDWTKDAAFVEAFELFQHFFGTMWD